MKNQDSKKRLQSLDVLRGMTVAGMILVNDGYGDTFAPLQHVEWNGMTPCDLVFPFFLYIMGVSTYLSLRKYQFQFSAAAGRKILKRTLVIFLIGLALNWLSNGLDGDWGWSHLRIMGVMQRIALCYGITSVVALLINHKYMLPLALGLLGIQLAQPIADGLTFILAFVLQTGLLKKIKALEQAETQG